MNEITPVDCSDEPEVPKSVPAVAVPFAVVYVTVAGVARLPERDTRRVTFGPTSFTDTAEVAKENVLSSLVIVTVADDVAASVAPDGLDSATVNVSLDSSAVSLITGIEIVLL